MSSGSDLSLSGLPRLASLVALFLPEEEKAEQPQESLPGRPGRQRLEKNEPEVTENILRYRFPAELLPRG